jgi:hypothetical protein
MSAEGRERIRQAQIKRWAALKSASKANMNETVAPTAQGKEEGRKGCLMGHVFDSRPGCGLNRKMQTATAT